MHPAPAAAASATRIATARFNRRRWLPAAWPRCWPRRAARWPKAIPGRPRPPGAKRSTAIRTRPKPCSIWAIWSASAASMSSPSIITGGRSSALPVMPACSTTWDSPTKRKARPMRPRPAIARCSPPPPPIPMRWPTSPISSSDAKTSPPPPKATRAPSPSGAMRRHRYGSSAALRKTASTTRLARKRASGKRRASPPTTSRSTATWLPTRWVFLIMPPPSQRCYERWSSTRAIRMRCRCSRTRGSNAASGPGSMPCSRKSAPRWPAPRTAMDATR